MMNWLRKKATPLGDAELVQIITDYLVGDAASESVKPLSPEMKTFYEVVCLDMEIGSGASFEQYFRWSSKEQIERVLSQLGRVGLDEIIGVTEEAIRVAFPDGVPDDPLARDECTEWTDDQEEALDALYRNCPGIHSLIETKLATFARRHDLLSLISTPNK
ncbi:hypothetical protein MWU49_06555 [Alcanivorax sp. S6407]|uniref:DMP19 family protein n=1 Tax=Alcanivorax sp. S6407 TaxID=2926424 RepID=UPI001FF1013F|nr:DUF4375 domain-containing protein [Alcanivorax sp. S6407]MCK0153354.1 hypothetical protein [Alcanivorax sp. S6407]